MNCDVFISYKHTDVNGNITTDYAIAEKLYKKLVSLGYNVFFFGFFRENGGGVQI